MEKEITFPDVIKKVGKTFYVSIFKKHAGMLDLKVGDEVQVTIKKIEVKKEDE